ncbi:MAG TPA: DUF3299 domain-containing protein [Alteromonas sp.]|jgi:hypothetical protein|nr:hypothetical protein [Alteromonas sp.]HCA75011.1 DUF3299 domain-containing protein [Alteromonas sp.]HCB09819.1 DUF3299 domain-containing protein [Alteromonas sp.]HCB17811.1 DUF3299 domain-containing protein [Alteromonas sp.]HCV19214.1 DUF3299 domain-containing protein [Alteromonas sp.]|tara:strand:- start:1839 stop:2324 length:486 start_codon:yes stop_codon:yes gene_type:complete
MLRLIQQRTASLLCCLMLVSGVVNASEVKEVYWEDLVPPDFNELAPQQATDHNNKMAQLQPDAPVVDIYNGERVKVPGFIVPLEGTAELTTEFLLVPFFGACIHVPPPPSNQIVHVKMNEGVPVENLYDAVWVEGIFSTTRYSSDLAAAGYSMQGEAVHPY